MSAPGRVVLVCGRICCGKTTYARKLCAAEGGLLLSVDELMLALLEPQLGDMHDAYARRAQAYLLEKAAQLAELGVGTVLDWGFWAARDRRKAREFFASRGIPCETHCISIPDGAWRARVEARNRAVRAGQAAAYFVDENLAAKCAARFEPPDASEIDVWIFE